MTNGPHGRKQNTSARRGRTVFALCAALAFLGAAGGIAYVNMRTAGSLYLQSDDGDLYLSIARNLLENAHFIQTARPIEAFVVPPGLPAACTLLLALDSGMRVLLGVQYAVYGLAAAFMALTALGLSLRPLQQAQFCWQTGRVRKAFPWVLSVLIGAAVPACYVWCSVKIRHPNPGFVLTENYVVFLIALILWLAIGRPLDQTDPRKVAVAAFVLTLFRPACSLLLVLALVWTVICYRKNLYSVFVMLLIFACVIAVNTGINYVETGEIIPLEDYSSMDVYLANNDTAPADWYHSGKVPEFASQEYNRIADNGGLTRYEQNQLAKAALQEYVKANPKTVVRNAAIRFEKLFCETWGPVFYAFCACLALQMILKNLRWQQKVFAALTTVFLAVPPAFGLLVARYSAPMVPLFITIIIGTTGQLVSMAAAKEKKEAVPASAEPGAGPTP